MATSGNSRDVKMTLSVETLGAEDIKKLQSSVANLAKEGGAAAPEFQHLADEIGRLGEQAAALQSFQRLADETTQLAQGQREAAATAADLRAKWETLNAATTEAAAKQRTTAAALQEAQVAARATRDELATLSATTDRAGKTEDAYAASVERLKVAKISQRAEIERLTAALAAANEGVKGAEAAEARLERAYLGAAAAADLSNTTLLSNTAAVRQAAAAATALGVGTENVAASQAEIARALNQSGTAAEALSLRVASLADAERELAQVQAFDKQHDAAKRLVMAGEYVALFDEALTRLAATQRSQQSLDADAKWQREAFAIVETAEATKKLTRETEVLSAAARELTAQQAFEKQAQDARKLLQAGEYVRFWTTELDKAEAQVAQTAEAAKAAGEKINNAFKTLGVRSAQELQAEIVQVRTAMETVRSGAATTGSALSGAFAAGEAKIKALERELRSLNGTVTLGDQAAKLFSNSLGQIAAGNIIADGVGYLVNKVKELGREFIVANVQMETMRRGLTAVYGSAQTAAAQIDFLRSASKSAGISMAGIADSFVRFNAATKSANIPLQVTNDLFASVTKAGSTLGLSGERVTLVLDALGQMASKGVVSMEELRQQLGDSMPGALSLAAKGFGVTDAQLIKLVESGQLAARDFFPAFNEGLKSLQSNTETLSTKFADLKNALYATATLAGDAGWTDVLKGGMYALKEVLGLVILPLALLGEGFLFTGKAAGIMFAALATGTNPLEALTEASNQADARLRKLREAFGQGSEGAAANSAAMTANASATGTSTSAALANEAASVKATIATGGLTGGILGATQAYYKMLVAQQADIKVVEANILASEKLLKSEELKGKALVQTAQLTGEASVILDAASAAAQNNAKVSEEIVKARQSEVAILEKLIDQRESFLIATNAWTGADKAAVEQRREGLKVQQASLEKSVQERAELEAQAQAASLAASAYRDNSLQVDVYRKALENARAELPTFKAAVEAATQEVKTQERLFAEGKRSREDVTQAQSALTQATQSYTRAVTEAAVAEARLKDGVVDAAKAMELKVQTQSASLQATLALINVEVSHLQTMSKIASAQGNSVLATQYEIDAKYKQIEAIKLSMQIKDLETKADIAALEIKRAEISATDPLLKQKQAEIDLRIQLQKTKLIEAGASKDVIAGIEDEIRAIREGTSARGEGVSSRAENVRAIGQEVDALDALNAKYGQSKKDRDAKYGAPGGGSTVATSGGDREKFLAGQNAVDNTLQFKLLEKSQRGQLTAADVEDAKRYLEAQKQQNVVNRDLDRVGGGFSAAGTLDRAKWEQFQAVMQNFVDTQNRKATAVPVPATAPPGTPPPGSTTHTVNVNLPGSNRSVNMASAADAAALTGILRQFESASGAAS